MDLISPLGQTLYGPLRASQEVSLTADVGPTTLDPGPTCKSGLLGKIGKL